MGGSDDKTIAVVTGASTEEVQALLAAIALRVGGRVAGVVEENPDAAARGRGGAKLRSLRTGQDFPIFQDLGPSSLACRLDAGGVVAACAQVEQDIAAGCDLVVLSKFAKLESERSGLMPAFAAAMAAHVPILTSVSPKFAEAWDRFADPLFVVLPAREAAVMDWWRGLDQRGRSSRLR